MKLAVAALLAASVSAKCEQGIKMKLYTDKKCEKALKDGAKKAIVKEFEKAELEEMNKKCNTLDANEANGVTNTIEIEDAEKKPGFLAMTCDTSSITAKVYAEDDKEECKGTAIGTLSVEWGKCTKVPGQVNKYMLYTAGAQAVAATAAAALAIVASQF